MDESLNGSIRVSLVATGISTNEISENENSEVHNLFTKKDEQPSLNSKLSDVDFSKSEVKYHADDIEEEGMCRRDVQRAAVRALSIRVHNRVVDSIQIHFDEVERTHCIPKSFSNPNLVVTVTVPEWLRGRS